MEIQIIMNVFRRLLRKLWSKLDLSIINGHPMGVIEGADFAAALFSLWELCPTERGPALAAAVGVGLAVLGAAGYTPEYEEYIKRTSTLFPRPSKKEAI